jgi:hypothetical protein
MNNTLVEFTKRIKEVDIYFHTLDLLDKGRCKILCTDIQGNELEKDIDNELSKILKANGFLLLYNLIEATIKKSIDEIFVTIHSSNITFKSLTENLKSLWINQEIKDLKDNTFNVATLRTKVMNISESILKSELTMFKSECVNISGNIDAKKIREVAKQFGYNEPSNGGGLQTIKNKRNHLAHGEYTFAEIGKDYTVGDLLQFKNETELYLTEVLKNIDDYLINMKFRSI